MNLEELRQALLQIIEEGRNLSLLETELVPHTEVRVKKGKTQDFLKRHQFQLRRIEQNNEAVYGLEQKNKQKRK